MDVPVEASTMTGGGVWRTLGTDSHVRLVDAEVLEVELPFVRPVETSVGVHRQRHIVLVRLRCRRGDGATVEGWGECAALSDRSFDAEDTGSAFAALTDQVLPALLDGAAVSGVLPAVGQLPTIVERDGRPLAWAAMEMAVGDVHLRTAGRSFADLLGVSGAVVAPGAVLGLPTSADALAAELARVQSEGFARVKIKVAPGSEHVLASALGSRTGERLPVQVDANGVYGPATLDGLRILDDSGLLCIEQPLGRNDLEGHRALATTLATPICLDESLDSPVRVVECVRSGACSVVCVKPARLGGIGAALDVIDFCRTSQVLWWVGGMFESGYARRVLTVLAALPGPSLPGDLAPPSTYLTGDLVGPATTSRDPDSGRLSVALHEGPGLSPAPGTADVDRWLVRRTSVTRRTP